MAPVLNLFICPVCGQSVDLYWHHNSVQSKGLVPPGRFVRLKTKEHTAARPVYGCAACGIFGKPGPSTVGGAAEVWRRRNYE